MIDCLIISILSFNTQYKLPITHFTLYYWNLNLEDLILIILVKLREPLFNLYFLANGTITLFILWNFGDEYFGHGSRAHYCL